MMMSSLDAIMEKEEEELLERVLSTLTPNERKAIILRLGLFGEEKHIYKKIGQSLNVCLDRARQICKKAIRKLSHPRHEKFLEEARCKPINEAIRQRKEDIEKWQKEINERHRIYLEEREKELEEREKELERIKAYKSEFTLEHEAYMRMISSGKYIWTA